MLSQISSRAQIIAAKSMTDSFVKISGEVKIIDSQYLLILKLNVSGNSQISVDKVRYYDQGEFTITSNRLFLKKYFRRTYVNIYTSGLRHPIYTDDWYERVVVSKTSPIIDTVNLGNYYPFEIGEYSISAEVDYWSKSEKHFVILTEIPFTVAFLPKQFE